MNRYVSQKYIDIERWSSYWYQAKEVIDLKPEEVLEIGHGNKVVTNLLNTYKIEVKTLDIDPETNPDIVASVENMPVADESFDVVLCAEVLEHLPFEKFGSNLREIRRVCRKGAVISVPHWGRHFSFEIRAPYIKRWRKAFKISWPKREQILGGEHFWEIGKKGYPLKRVKTEIEKAGFQIVDDYVLFEMPYHHLFVLKK